MTIQANFPAIKPSLLLDFANTKQLDSRITYTRASTASFYNGVTTAMAEQNLFLYSQDLTNGYWNKNNTTVTGNVSAAPDGTTTSNLLAETTGNNDHRLALISAMPFTSGLSYTYSIYAKVGTGATAPSSIQIYAGAFVSNFYVNFNISTGTVGTSNGFTGTITSVGSGWYRLTATATATTTTSTTVIGVVFNNNNNSATYVPSYTGATTSDVFLWGAQLEQRSAVTAYTATTTQAITNYIPVLQSAASGVARFDNNPTTGESLGLLIEESRTNICLYSSDFSNAAYNLVNATVAVNTDIAPDGTLTADTLTGTASFGRIYQSVNYTAGAWTFSIYVKKKSSSSVFAIAFSETGAGDEVSWNINTGVVASQGANVSSATITDVGLYWRVTATSTRTATTGKELRIFAGYGTNINPVIWGAQLEAGAFATSYIPTVASQVTRAADAASMTGTNFSSWYNQGEGTLFSNSITPDTAAAFIITITDGTGNNQINTVSGAAGGGAFQVGVNGTLVVNTGTRQLNSKTAGAYKVNDFSVSTNGSAVSTDADGILPIVNRLDFGRRSDTTSFNINGTIKKFAYYPIRLSNTNLVALTS
jgi:hypothetical protein